MTEATTDNANITVQGSLSITHTDGERHFFKEARVIGVRAGVVYVDETVSHGVAGDDMGDVAGMPSEQHRIHEFPMTDIQTLDVDVTPRGDDDAPLNLCM